MCKKCEIIIRRKNVNINDRLRRSKLTDAIRWNFILAMMVFGAGFLFHSPLIRIGFAVWIYFISRRINKLLEELE